MSNILAVHFGRVKNGKLVLTDKARFEAGLAKLEGREVELTIRKPDHGRTLAENRYYWGVIVSIVAEEIGLTPDEAHELLGQNLDEEESTDERLTALAESVINADAEQPAEEEEETSR